MILCSCHKCFVTFIIVHLEYDKDKLHIFSCHYRGSARERRNPQGLGVISLATEQYIYSLPLQLRGQ